MIVTIEGKRSAMIRASDVKRLTAGDYANGKTLIQFTDDTREIVSEDFDTVCNMYSYERDCDLFQAPYLNQVIELVGHLVSHETPKAKSNG